MTREEMPSVQDWPKPARKILRAGPTPSISPGRHVHPFAERDEFITGAGNIEIGDASRGPSSGRRRIHLASDQTHSDENGARLSPRTSRPTSPGLFPQTDLMGETTTLKSDGTKVQAQLRAGVPVFVQ